MEQARPRPSAPGEGSPPDGATRAGPGADTGEQAQAWFMARLLERTTQPYALVAFSGRIERVNRAFAELTGYTSDELIKLNLSDITPPRWMAEKADTLDR